MNTLSTSSFRLLLIATLAASYSLLSAKEIGFTILNKVAFSGDHVLYQIQSDRESADPITLRIKLYSDDTTAIAEHYVQISNEQNHHSGLIEIPFSAKTGKYLLVISAYNKSKSVESIFYSSPIVVIDPFSTPDYVDIEPKTSPPSDYVVTEREEIILDTEADYFFALDHNLNPDTRVKLYDEDDSWSSDIFRPITVTDVKENSFGIKSLPLITAYSPSMHTMHNLIRLGQNLYLLELPDLVGSDEIVLFCNSYKEMIDFDYEEVIPEVVDDFDFGFAGVPSYLRPLIESRQKEKTLDSYFDLKHITFDTLDQTYLPFPRPDNSINVQTYENLGNVAEFFEEVFTNLRTKRSRKETKLIMLNRENSGDFDHTIFIVDGTIALDSEDLIELKSTDFSRVDMYYDLAGLKENFGTVSSNTAIAVFTSRDGILSFPEESNLVTINGYSRSVNPRFPPAEGKGNVPQFSPWLSTNIESHSTRANDRSGVYEVLGFTKDEVEPTYQAYIKVQSSQNE